jgi:hypothetical protein
MPSEAKLLRDEAQSSDHELERDRRKKLGQFFTGMPLGRLLAELSVSAQTHTIFDPMAGTGDLLEAASQVAKARGLEISSVAAIEIDPSTASLCEQRLSAIPAKIRRTISGDAFDPRNLHRLGLNQFDLVITNPPYVRYQSQNGAGQNRDAIRASLEKLVEDFVQSGEQHIWLSLIRGYSGLADLSIPAWILSGMLVKPGGRLALVAPATWRSREYADVVRYLLLRCFQIEYVVQDTQPGWFSDALVRTQLIVARRETYQRTIIPLAERPHFLPAKWIEISPTAGSPVSLVGSAFDSPKPEGAFSEWAARTQTDSVHGITLSEFSLEAEWHALGDKIRRRSWCSSVENTEIQQPGLFFPSREEPTVIPQPIARALGEDASRLADQSTKQAGIQIGQGLRTGCNAFFYVDADTYGSDAKTVTVTASALFSHRRIPVPISALKPVLRRQSELRDLSLARIPPGRLLDLRQWEASKDAGRVEHATQRKQMPIELAEYVRDAETTIVKNGMAVSRLSAVKTNVRRTADGPPRHWYMVPDFAPRHLPLAFVPRVIGGEPRTEKNFPERILIDANFTTIWCEDGKWSAAALKALFNSTWCIAYMEAIGTPLGGGALKLEAAHLRQLRIPNFSDAQRAHLSKLGDLFGPYDATLRRQIDTLVLGVLVPHANESTIARHLAALSRTADDFRRARLRK